MADIACQAAALIPCVPVVTAPDTPSAGEPIKLRQAVVSDTSAPAMFQARFDDEREPDVDDAVHRQRIDDKNHEEELLKCPRLRTGVFLPIFSVVKASFLTEVCV